MLALDFASFVILHFQKENDSTMDELIQQVAALEVIGKQ
jgi:hypothetical protein